MGLLERLLEHLGYMRRPTDGEQLAQLLESFRGFRVLRELTPTAALDDLGEPLQGQRVGAVVDTETTGLDPLADRLMEIAIQRFAFDAEGHILAIERSISWLEDPGRPIPPRIGALTGLNDADLTGQRFDDRRIVSLLGSADLIIAHNAAFDRPFLDRRFPSLDKSAWACSLAQLDWASLGFDGRALGHLLLQNGWYFRGHRAEQDVQALTTLLATEVEDNRTILSHLLERCEQPTFRIEAVGARFEAKDALKGRGYRWDPQKRYWWREVEEPLLEAETVWLDRMVYQAEGRPLIHRVSAQDRFKSPR